MNLPKQVQEQERRANEAIERMQQAQQPAAPAAEAPPQQVPSVAATPAPDWETRYKTLQGKYNAEVPRLSELVKVQQAQIEGLTREVEALKTRPPAADTRVDLTADLPDDLKERFDPDMIKLVSEIAAKSADRLANEVKPVMERVQAQESQRAEQLLTQQRQAEMLDALNDLSPGWEQADASPGFVAFLEQIDPATGKPLRDTLTAAVQRFDAATAARIFNRYAASAPKPPSAPLPPNLAAQVVPDIAGAGSSAPDGNKRTYTVAEAKAMYARSASLLNSNPAEAQRIEREIELAHREGRIR